ncbi:MAG: hypothetical protein AAGJ35_13745, partial [Myxococcota bacterium]
TALSIQLQDESFEYDALQLKQKTLRQWIEDAQNLLRQLKRRWKRGFFYQRNLPSVDYPKLFEGTWILPSIQIRAHSIFVLRRRLWKWIGHSPKSTKIFGFSWQSALLCVLLLILIALLTNGLYRLTKLWGRAENMIEHVEQTTEHLSDNTELAHPKQQARTNTIHSRMFVFFLTWGIGLGTGTLWFFIEIPRLDIWESAGLIWSALLFTLVGHQLYRGFFLWLSPALRAKNFWIYFRCLFAFSGFVCWTACIFAQHSPWDEAFNIAQSLVFLGWIIGFFIMLCARDALLNAWPKQRFFARLLLVGFVQTYGLLVLFLCTIFMFEILQFTNASSWLFWGSISSVVGAWVLFECNQQLEYIFRQRKAMLWTALPALYWSIEPWWRGKYA